MVPVNYLAVLASAVLMMALGFLWYGPLFGKTWSQLMRWSEMTPEKMKEMQKKARPAYAATFLGALVMSFVMSHTLIFASTYLHESGISAGLQTGFWNWLGFVVPVTIGTVFWDGKPWKLWIINAGYYLLGMLLIGVLLALWV